MLHEVILIIKYIDWKSKKIEVALTKEQRLPVFLLDYEKEVCVDDAIDLMLKLHTGFSIIYLPYHLMNYRDDKTWRTYLDKDVVSSMLYLVDVPERQAYKNKDYETIWIEYTKLTQLNEHDAQIMVGVKLC